MRPNVIKWLKTGARKCRCRRPGVSDLLWKGPVLVQGFIPTKQKPQLIPLSSPQLQTHRNSSSRLMAEADCAVSSHYTCKWICRSTTLTARERFQKRWKQEYVESSRSVRILFAVVKTFNKSWNKTRDLKKNNKKEELKYWADERAEKVKQLNALPAEATF